MCLWSCEKYSYYSSYYQVSELSAHPFQTASSLVLSLSLTIFQYGLQADQAVLAVELEVDVAALDLEYCGSHPVCGADDCPD